jgi:hypothetical protein
VRGKLKVTQTEKGSIAVDKVDSLRDKHLKIRVSGRMGVVIPSCKMIILINIFRFTSCSLNKKVMK